MLALAQAVEQLAGDREVLLQLHRRAVPHVRLEQRQLARRHPLLRDRDQRPHVALELVRRAVVGVQRDVDAVLLGHDVGELGQRDRAGDHVLLGLAGRELGAAPETWMMPSLSASAKPCSAALIVEDEVQLMAG